MEYFSKAKYVRIKSLQNRYLVARKDGESVKLSRNGHAIQAYWAVEMVKDGENLIRLRSCHDKFLTASDEPFLLGWTGAKSTVFSLLYACKTKDFPTGDKVLQTSWTDNDPSVHWEPVVDHSLFIRLRNPLYDKFLRANGGTPPWRNTVTVNVPWNAVTQDWILWSVEPLNDQGIDIDQCAWPGDSKTEDLFSTWNENDQYASEGSSSPMSSTSPVALTAYKSVTPDIQNAKTVRLLSHHDKYLFADEDGESVSQDRRGSSKQAYWTLEHISTVKGGSLVRLKSSQGKYLTATDDNFLLGATGKKIKQTKPQRLDYSIEWELTKEGMQVKLQTWDGNFLRGNGGLPPWRNSVTHDVPSLSPTKDWILWKIEVFDAYEDESRAS